MEKRAYISIYCSSVLYNFSLAMIHILVPLYAYYLSSSPFYVGLIISSQGILQFFLRIYGGVVTDRYGERIILIFSYGSMLIAALLFMISNTLWMLVVIQLIMGLSRSIYWTSSQSYASRVNESKREKVLGSLTGYVNIGSVCGYIIAGLVLERYGFAAGFRFAAGLCAISFLLAIIMPNLARKNVNRTMKDLMKTMPALLIHRVVIVAGIAAGVASIPVVLLASFYPVYIKETGFSESNLGLMIALSSVGTIIVSFLFSRLTAHIGQKKLYAFNMWGTGLVLIITPLFNEMWILSLVLLSIGITSGMGIVLYQIIATQYSGADQRGMYLASVGLYWSLAQMTIPAFFGYVSSLIGLDYTYIILGVVLVAVSFVTPLLFRMLQKAVSAESGK